MMNALWKAAALMGASLLLALLSCSGSEAAPAIVVDSTADTDSRDGVVTLREAILLASGELAVADLDSGEADNVSGHPGPESNDVITFDELVFLPSEPASISLAASLPPLSTGADTIDGSQTGVRIDGLNKSLECVVIASNDNAVKGLEIENCLVGVMLRPGAQGNEIGGPGPGEGNVISANDAGIVIGGAGADGNAVRGNLIGVDASGSSALGNRDGVDIQAEAQGNLIGGSKPGEGNIISGNDGVGITIGGSANLVKGNYIGTDISGSAAIPNGMEGIWIALGAQNNVVGGTTAGERNVISGNTLFGLRIAGAGASANLVEGNYLGINASGTAALRNRHALVVDRGAQGNVIGGTGTGEANVISGNETGILMRDADTSGNVILGNYIGTDPSGRQPLPNIHGMWIFNGAHHNTIGGTDPSEGNVISGNKIGGVLIEGADTRGNTVRGNSIYANDVQGINNNEGGNMELTPPTISSASPVAGSACPNCTVDIYSDSQDQGEVYQGSIVADNNGSFTFDVNPARPYITATATDSDGNTSMFSNPFPTTAE